MSAVDLLRGPVVVFDGVCNFCSHGVQFLLSHDRSGEIKFVTAQSNLGARLLNENGVSATDPHTFLFIDQGQSFLGSDAAIEVSKYLGPWRVLSVFRILPLPIRNFVYDVIARNRYKWFGKREVCFSPSPEQRSRFIDK